MRRPGSQHQIIHRFPMLTAAAQRQMKRQRLVIGFQRLQTRGQRAKRSVGASCLNGLRNLWRNPVTVHVPVAPQVT